MLCVRRSLLAAAVVALGLLSVGLRPAPVLDSQGRALGVLSTLQIAPLPAGNGVGDLSHELAYARHHVPALTDLQVVNGTRAFDGNQLPLGL